MPLGTVNFYLAPNLPPARHAFFGRCGGASTDKYDSFNFNYRSKDKPENIERNLELVGKFYFQTAIRYSNILNLCGSHDEQGGK